jgi:hypothetical protein
VQKRDGSALSGVEITVLDHAEFGRTLSRADGAFDLAVNGGGVLTVNHKRTGYLPVQRQVNAPWQDYEMIDEVVMVPLDTAVTTIDFSTPMQVARASVVTRYSRAWVRTRRSSPWYDDLEWIVSVPA